MDARRLSRSEQITRHRLIVTVEGHAYDGPRNARHAVDALFALGWFDNPAERGNGFTVMSVAEYDVREDDG